MGEGAGAALALGARLGFRVAETAFLTAGTAVLFLTAGDLLDARVLATGFALAVAAFGVLDGAAVPVLTKDLAGFLAGAAALAGTDFLAGTALAFTLGAGTFAATFAVTFAITFAGTFEVTFLFKVFTSCLLAVLKGRSKPVAAEQQTIGIPVH